MRRFVVGIFSAFILVSGSVPAADWPAFRGPFNTGVAAENEAPTTWGPDENVAWKAPLPRPGNGSPIVTKGKVFVTSAEDKDGHKRSLYCFDAKSGKQLWVRTVDCEQKMPTHDTNPFCGTTPVADERHVVVWHATAGLFCYDLDGKELWSRNFGEFRHMWGYGTSPILHAGRVILHSGPGKRVFLAALALDSGKTLWDTDEPLDGGPDQNSAGKYMGSWSTPLVTQVGGKDQIIVMMPTRVNAYDPANGQIIWTCGGMRHDRGDLAYSSPIIVGDLCFVTGGFNGVAMAVRLGGTGDVTETHRVWRAEKQPQNIGSGVAVDGFVYRPNAGPSTIECIEPATGKVRWSTRSPAGNHWGSIVQVGKLLYVTGQDASTVVFKPNPDKLEVVSVNKLTGSCNATPAVSDGRIFIRTDGFLYCIGK